jgi:hypothetical protein
MLECLISAHLLLINCPDFSANARKETKKAAHMGQLKNC